MTFKGTALNKWLRDHTPHKPEDFKVIEIDYYLNDAVKTAHFEIGSDWLTAFLEADSTYPYSLKVKAVRVVFYEHYMYVTGRHFMKGLPITKEIA